MYPDSRLIKTVLLGGIMIASFSLFPGYPIAQANTLVTEGSFVILQEGTATLKKDKSPFEKGTYQIEIEISSDYSFVKGNLKASGSGVLTVVPDSDPDSAEEFLLKDVKVTASKDLKTVTYSGKVDDSEGGAVSGTLKFSSAISFSASETRTAREEVNSMNARVGNAIFDTKKTSTAILELDANSGSVQFTRTTLPIPPENGQDVADLLGSSVFTKITVTDPGANQDSDTEEPLGTTGFDIVDDDSSTPGFYIQVTTSANDQILIETDGDFDGSDCAEIETNICLGDIMVLPSLLETNVDSGVFEGNIEFTNDGSVVESDWRELSIKFVYRDSDGNEGSKSISFSGNQGMITADVTTVKIGDTLTITIQDEDLNLDDDTAEEFESSIGTDDAFILSIESQEDSISGIEPKTFVETGKNTGIFKAGFKIGEDIPVGEYADQNFKHATNIEIVYNDETGLDVESANELALDIPVKTNDGTITAAKTGKVGGKIKVVITDKDLNLAPSEKDEYLGDEFGQGFIILTTNIEYVGEASPDIIESGVKTGVFEFSISLVPRSDFSEAVGGSDPEVPVAKGDTLTITYIDFANKNGVEKTVTAKVKIK